MQRPPTFGKLRTHRQEIQTRELARKRMAVEATNGAKLNDLGRKDHHIVPVLYSLSPISKTLCVGLKSTRKA